MPPPPFLPPPAPLGAPPPVVAPSPPPPLSVGDKARHVGWFLGSFSGAGVLGYSAGVAWMHGWIGSCELTLVGGLALLIAGSGLWALVPLWAEWHTFRRWQAMQDTALAYQGAHWREMLRSQQAFRTKYLTARELVPDPPIPIRHMGRVVGVETPSAPPAPTVTDTVDRMREVVGAWLQRQPTPPPDRITTRLDALPPGPPPPRIPYTADLRAVVDLFLRSETVSGPEGQAALGISDRQWRARCKVLEGAGVLVTPRGQERRLAPSLARMAREYDGAAVHRRVTTRLAK